MSAQLDFRKGEAGLTVQYLGDLIDAAMTIDTNLLAPPVSATHYIRFTAGANAGLVAGVTLTGQSSSAVVAVVAVVTTSGTIGASDAAGLLFVRVISGTVTSGENLRVSTTTYCVARSSQLANRFAGMNASALYMTCETNSIRYTLDGVVPINSSGTPASLGHLLVAGDNLLLMGMGNIRNLGFLNAASASNGVLTVSVIF